MNKESVAVIVPCFNEEEGLPQTLDEILAHFSPENIIVVNDGSKDHTPYVAKKKNVVLISLPINMGIGIAMQTGYRYALQNGFLFAVQCDGDGQHPPDKIEALLKKMNELNADMVLGSRFVDDSVEGFKSFAIRRIGIKYLSFLINVITGKKIYDVTSGFRLVNRKVMEIFSNRYPFDYPEPESIVLLDNHGVQIAETPVSMRERKGGISSITAIKGIYYMVKVTIGLLVTKLRGKN